MIMTISQNRQNLNFTFCNSCKLYKIVDFVNFCKAGAKN